MPRTNDISVIEKQRMRSEIASQVEEFLRNGGRIQVVEKETRSPPASIGSAWHDNDDLMDLSD